MNKQRKARIREMDKKARMRELLELEKNAGRLKTMTSGFARPATVAKKVTKTLSPPQDRVLPRLPAKYDPQVRQKSEPALASSVVVNKRERDARAEAVAAEQRSRIFPLYNKGGLGYYTEEMMKDVKSGANRRRS